MKLQDVLSTVKANPPTHCLLCKRKPIYVAGFIPHDRGTAFDMGICPPKDKVRTIWYGLCGKCFKQNKRENMRPAEQEIERRMRMETHT